MKSRCCYGEIIVLPICSALELSSLSRDKYPPLNHPIPPEDLLWSETLKEDYVLHLIKYLFCTNISPSLILLVDLRPAKLGRLSTFMMVRFVTPSFLSAGFIRFSSVLRSVGSVKILREKKEGCSLVLFLLAQIEEASLAAN